MPACAATNLPRVDGVLATLQVSSHKCKVMFYTEVLGSEDFRSVLLCLCYGGFLIFEVYWATFATCFSLRSTFQFLSDPPSPSTVEETLI